MAPEKKKPTQKEPLDQPKKVADKAEKMLGGVFANLKKHLETKKVDAFQKEWLSNPKNRKKYENIKDVPEMVVEEAKAMTDDMIQFLQKQKGGNSILFKKIKSKTSEFLKNPAEFVQQKPEPTSKLEGKPKKVTKNKAVKKVVNLKIASQKKKK